MKLKTAIQYKLSVQWRSVLIYLGFFLLFAVIFPLMPMLLIDGVTNVHVDLLAPAMIYIMILSTTSVGNDFKLFIQCGTSRLHIFVANFVSSLILTFGLSIVLKMLFELFNGGLIPNFFLQYQLITLITGGNFWPSMFLLWVFLILAASIGMMIGALLNRFDGYLRLAIGALSLGIVILGSILFQLLSPAAKMAVIDFIKLVIGLGANGLNSWQFIGFIFVVSLILLVIVYLLNRRQEVKRINA